MNVRRLLLWIPVLCAIAILLAAGPARAGQVLKYDDGSAENGIGLDNGAAGTYDLWWANAFQTSPTGKYVEAI